MRNTGQILIALIAFAVLCLVFGKELHLAIPLIAGVIAAIVMLWLPIRISKKLHARGRGKWLYIWEGKFCVLALFVLIFSGRAYGIFYSFVLGGGLIFCGIETLFGLLYGVKNYRGAAYLKNYAFRLFVFNIAALLLFFAATTNDSNKATQTLQNGSKLISLIEQYKSNYGKYPANIESIPGQAAIKPALKNTSFEYKALDNGGYRLGFYSVAWTYCFYENTRQDWTCND